MLVLSGGIDFKKHLPEESSFTVTDPEDTKNFFDVPSCSYTVTTPGLRTASVGT